MNANPRQCQRQFIPRGFALIVTLSLMILLTVIAVGLLTLSSVTLRSSSQGNAMAVAHANARMAMMIALGDLQKLAGPDQRISARADVVDENIANPRLTGIWESWEIKPDSQPTDFEKTARDAKFRGWLVSGNPVESKTLGFAAKASPALTAAANKSPLGVTLWGKGSLGDQPLAKSVINVSKIPLISSPGAVAWAVMDEGVKARINTRYTDDIVGSVTNEGAKTARLGAGERAGVEFISGLNTLDRAFFEASATEGSIVRNGITRQNFSLAGEKLGGSAIPTELKKLTHDVTTVSTGLFTDTARGGLKQDFQLLTNAGILPPEYLGKGIYDSRAVMPSGGGPSDPRWESLQQFATIYKETSYITKLSDVPVLKVKIPEGWTASSQSGNPLATVVNRTPPAGVVLAPTIAKVQLLFSLIVRDIYPNLPGSIFRPLTVAEKAGNMHGPQDGFFRATKYNYDLHLLYTPIITLHNPYNVAIDFSSMRLEFIGVPFAMQVFRNDMPLSKGLVPFESMTDDNQNSQKSKTFGMNLKTKVNGKVGGPNFRMLPGEVILFSPYIDPKRTYAQDLKDRKFWDISLATGLTNNIDAIPGWRGFGIGYDCDWLAGNQPTIGRANVEDRSTAAFGIWKGCYGVAWDDRIHVEFAPISIPVNKNKFVVQLTANVAGLAKKISAIEMDYETPTGLQEFLSSSGGKTTQRFPKEDASKKYVLGHELRDNSTTPIGEIANVKPFALLTAQAKNTSGGRDVTNKDGRFAGKPWAFAHGSIGSSSQKIIKEHSANHSHEIDLRILDDNDRVDFPSVDKATDRSSFVTGNTNYNGSKFGSLYDIPLAPVQTLGGLNGANPGGSSGFLPRFAQPIGNSWAHPLISPEKLLNSGPGGYNYLDHSFLLNLALYDGFYFSGFADQTGSFGNGKTAKTIAQAFAGGSSLDDPRMQLRPPNGKKPADLPDAISQPGAYKNMAAWQLMDGCFNINSTSVPAWKAMLASIHDSQAPVNQRATGATPSTSLVPLKSTATGETRISRMRLPASSSAAQGASLEDAYWLGPREYSDTQLEVLASNIVKQVRLRGPFLSMAEFVNRRLGTGETAQRGALQQAIDDSDLNKRLAEAANAGYEIPPGISGSYKHNNSKAGEGPSYQGAPGYLTQADILNVLGNAATARSDTFTIRGYGEARDPSGKLVASALCEAVVQRIPEWVDPVDAVETPVASLASVSNRTFGRRFLISSLRWLTPGEV